MLTEQRYSDDLVAALSNDIRTPVHGVLGMTRLLLETGLDGEQREYASAIQRSTEDLLQLINDMLDISRMEAGSLAIRPIPFDLRVAVEEVASLLSHRANEKRLGLVIRVAPDLPRFVLGDPGRLRQVLSTLASNAIQTTSEGHVLINVEPAPDAAAEWCRITIEDTGSGLDAALLGVVSGTRPKLDPGGPGRSAGGGIGLVIASELVQLMGGRMGVEQVPGAGRCIWLALPLPPDPSARPLPAPQASLADVRVMIVDPDRTWRQVLTEQLESSGLQPTGLSTGEEALEELRRSRDDAPYGLVLIAAALPDMLGETLGRLIKADAMLHQSVLLYLASAGVPGDGARLHGLGFAAYLLKPLGSLDLHDAVALAWETREQEPPAPLITRHALAEARVGEVTPLIGHRRPRILLVEDNVVNQRMTLRMLEKLGCTTVLAGNGHEALARLGQGSLDLILMDCEMPELDGWETTRQIRARKDTAASLPIVALTGSASKADRDRCLAAGMDDFVTKPTRPEDLRSLLQRWVPDCATAAGGAVRAEFSADATMAGELHRLFLRDTPSRLAELRRAVATGDQAQVARVAHTIKGASWVVGAEQVALLAEGLERQAGTESTRLGELSTRLAVEFDRWQTGYAWAEGGCTAVA